MKANALRARYPGWQVWQSREGLWWATRRSTRSLPPGASLTVGDARSLDELRVLIEADDAYLFEYGHLGSA